MFDMREDGEADPCKLAQMMQNLGVFISVKPKVKQTSKVTYNFINVALPLCYSENCPHLKEMVILLFCWLPVPSFQIRFQFKTTLCL